MTKWQQQQEFLARAAQLELQMQLEAQERQLRLDAMARILSLADPHEQLTEYLALRLADEQRHTSSASDSACSAATDVTRELLECAQQLPAGDDSDVALLAAFFFSCDTPPPASSTFSRSRGAAPLLPVVAAMMKRAAGASLEQPVLL